MIGQIKIGQIVGRPACSFRRGENFKFKSEIHPSRAIFFFLFVALCTKRRIYSRKNNGKWNGGVTFVSIRFPYENQLYMQRKEWLLRIFIFYLFLYENKISITSFSNNMEENISIQKIFCVTSRRNKAKKEEIGFSSRIIVRWLYGLIKWFDTFSLDA